MSNSLSVLVWYVRGRLARGKETAFDIGTVELGLFATQAEAKAYAERIATNAWGADWAWSNEYQLCRPNALVGDPVDITIGSRDAK